MCISAALAALALGLSACGGDGAEEPAAAKQSDQEKIRAAELKFAQCMRENGVESFPDPGADGGTRIKVGPETGIDPQELEAAAEQCKELREDIAPQLSEGDEQKFKEQALEHARCMREHGIDFPDPEFSAGGEVTMRLKKGDGPGPEDPEFQAADKACGGGGRGVGSKAAP